jgi:hypothetical protein
MFICDSGARNVLRGGNIEGTGMEERPDKLKKLQILEVAWIKWLE